MARIAPEIFRKRLLIEGYFARQSLDAQAIRDYFTAITGRLLVFARHGGLRAGPVAPAEAACVLAVAPLLHGLR